MFGRKFTHKRDWPFGHSHAPAEARDHARQTLNNTGRHQSSSRLSKGLLSVDAAPFSKSTPWSTPLERNPLKPRISELSESEQATSVQPVKFPKDSIEQEIEEARLVAARVAKNVLEVLNADNAGDNAAFKMKEKDKQALLAVEAALSLTLPFHEKDKIALSAWVLIRMPKKGPDTRQLRLELHGYGRAPRSPLSMLSSFSLQLVDPSISVAEDASFIYGRRLNPLHVNFQVARELLSQNKSFGCSSYSTFHMSPKYLGVALLWQPAEAITRRTSAVNLPPRKSIVPPTWSWAGWICEVQYEQTFDVRTDSIGGLVKLIGSGDKEERVGPLLHWYICRKKLQARKIVPLHRRKGELGVLEPPDDEKLPESLRETPDLPLSLLNSLDERHLIFRTSCARFKVGDYWNRKETHRLLDQRNPKMSTVTFGEVYNLDSSGEPVGSIKLHSPDTLAKIQSREREFIAISEEVQYFGSEKRVDVRGFPLYNVMLIKWDAERNIAERRSLEKIYKHA